MLGFLRHGVTWKPGTLASCWFDCYHTHSTRHIGYSETASRTCCDCVRFPMGTKVCVAASRCSSDDDRHEHLPPMHYGYFTFDRPYATSPPHTLDMRCSGFRSSCRACANGSRYGPVHPPSPARGQRSAQDFHRLPVSRSAIEDLDMILDDSKALPLSRNERRKAEQVRQYVSDPMLVAP